jgi:broad specificity phosphatase PhoE
MMSVMDGDRQKSLVALRRRPLYSLVWLAALGAVAGIGSLAMLGLAIWLWSTADATIVIVIRHAEQELNGSADPPLSAVGQARAEALAQLFGRHGDPGSLDVILTSTALRSRATAAPVARRLGLTPIALAAANTGELVRRALHDHEGGRILIVAHADTIPKILAGLRGHSDPEPVTDTDYGAIYIVTVPRLGRANLVSLHY